VVWVLWLFRIYGLGIRFRHYGLWFMVYGLGYTCDDMRMDITLVESSLGGDRGSCNRSHVVHHKLKVTCHKQQAEGHMS